MLTLTNIHLNNHTFKFICKQLSSLLSLSIFVYDNKFGDIIIDNHKL